MAKSLFPEEMLMKTAPSFDFSLEGVAQKLKHFEEQIHLIHWQTSIYAEHLCTGDLYDYLHDFRDDVIEKMMGYTSRKPKAFKFLPINDGVTSTSIITELKEWANELQSFASANKMNDIENMSQDLSGKAAKSLYLLTLS